MTLEQFHNKDSIVIKEEFEKRYRELLGDRYQTFIDFSLSFSKRAIRINTLKVSIDELKKRIANQWTLREVPWCPYGFWIEHKGKDDEYRRDIGNITEHTLGYFYVQDPASMIPPIVLNPTSSDRVLDMCAAPGSKTTQLAQIMNNQGIIVANELIGSRIAALGVNVQRMGVLNTVITQKDANRIPRNLMFTKILLDAPCSGTGTIRKSPKTFLSWNPRMIDRLHRTQSQLLEQAYLHLEKGGNIVYSTCTLEPQENEGVISVFLNNHPDMKTLPITLSIQRSSPIEQFNSETYNPQVKNCLRIYPQDNDTEGFFVCHLKKE